MKNSRREIKDIFVFLSIPCYNSNASYPCQGAWWTWMKSPGRTNFISKCPLMLSLLWQLLLCDPQLWSEVGSPQQYPLTVSVDQWCIFYLKLKKYWLKLATYVRCQGINSWGGLFYSLSILSPQRSLDILLLSPCYGYIMIYICSL